MPCDDTNADGGSYIDDSNNDDEEITADKTENLMLANLEHMRLYMLEAKEMRGLVNENTKIAKDYFHLPVH